MTNSGATNKAELKKLIVDVIDSEKPSTTQQLVELAKQKTLLSEKQILELLLELESNEQIHFNRPQPTIPATVKQYVFSKSAMWFWVCTGFCIATVLSLLIPENAYPATYLRTALAVVFGLFLPGFSLTKALFPKAVPLKIDTDIDNTDKIERFVVSLGLSLALLPLVALILNYTPWGIRLAPLATALLAFTLILSTAGLIREYQAKKPKNQPQKSRLID